MDDDLLDDLPVLMPATHSPKPRKHNVPANIIPNENTMPIVKHPPPLRCPQCNEIATKCYGSQVRGQFKYRYFACKKCFCKFQSKQGL